MGLFKNSIIAAGVMAIAAVTSLSANASLLIEPHLGYILSSSTTYQTETIKYTGPQYGARLGVQYLGLMGGLDFTHSTFTEKVSTPAISVDSKQKRDDLGIFVGYSAPIMLRAWIAYYFSAKQSNVDTSGYIKGHATEIGLGFTPLPLLSINLSYKMLSFDENQAGTFSPKLEPKEIVLGVSCPITLL